MLSSLSKQGSAEVLTTIIMQLKRTGMENTTLMKRPWESKYCWRLKDCQFFAAYWLIVSEERTVSSSRKKRMAWVVWWLRVITVTVVRRMWNSTSPTSQPSLQSIWSETTSQWKNINCSKSQVYLITRYHSARKSKLEISSFHRGKTCLTYPMTPSPKVSSSKSPCQHLSYTKYLSGRSINLLQLWALKVPSKFPVPRTVPYN